MASQSLGHCVARAGGSESVAALGPEGGLNVVALKDGVTHGRKLRCITPSFMWQASRS